MDYLDFYQGRRVFVTGHTGFKGSWLTLWLREHGAIVSGFSVDLPTSPSLFEALGLAADVRHFTGDIRNAEYLGQVIDGEQPEIIFHLAAQPLVRRGHRFPKETFDVNVGGTVNLLEAARHANSLRSIICVTSDKCYDCQSGDWAFRESDPLGGTDPYSASKAAAEIAVAAYRESFFSRTSISGSGAGLASVRAGNVIGGGDWAEDRIVPDCIRALASDEPIPVRRPEAMRPWQHVLEPLAGYLTLAIRLAEEPEKYSGAWNFGPLADRGRTVAELVQEIVRLWTKGKAETDCGRARLPSSRFGRSLALPDPVSASAREAACLRLCSDKAMANLPWRPQWSFHHAVRRTVEWYLAFYREDGVQDLRVLCRRQIAQYQNQWVAIGQESGIRDKERHESAPMPVV
jgi:CDP-glucose 4,6-dehydratase